MSGQRIVIIEDDVEIGETLLRILEFERYHPFLYRDGKSGLEQALFHTPDLVILDLGLPDIDGLEVAKELRKESAIPILMLTARDAVESRVQGLDSGADDYLVKPFAKAELLARIRALLRRAPTTGEASLTYADIKLDEDTYVAKRGERVLKLTQREFQLLKYLVQNREIVISRDRLLDEVWSYDAAAFTNTVDVFISNLRRKLEENGESRVLHTIRGVGYVLRENNP